MLQGRNVGPMGVRLSLDGNLKIYAPPCPVCPLGKLGSRLGPPIFRGRQFCRKQYFWKFTNGTTLDYILILIH